MLKLSDRSIFIGLSVIALSIAVPSLLLNHSRRHTEEQDWSSVPRASVSTGAVRENAASAVITESSGYSGQQAKQMEHSAGIDNAADLRGSEPQEQIAIRSTRERSLAHSPAKARLSHPKASPMMAKGAHAGSARSTADDNGTPKSAQSNIDPPASANSLSVAQPINPTNAPSFDAYQEHDREQSTMRGAPVDLPVQANRSNLSEAPSQMTTATPQPKTREEVQAELRKARMSGALPRFGNPDPYGPGGAPSTSNE